MKNLIIIMIAFFGCYTSTVIAQEMGDKEKMKVFEGWAGRWQGEGAMQMGPGEPKKSKVDEIVQLKLDGMVLLVEGKGFVVNPATKEETVVHHALAVLSYDKNTSQYKFKTYLKDGRSADAWFTVLGDNKFQWGFDVPGRKIRYNITIDSAKKTWNEIGESSVDGTNWGKFFEMNLTKTE
ncbi:DUF1579 domain-containing protein [Pseudochryseolinea flava]|uniref:DUF1579 domain-containing protein n=1 Tax=Pseudochryseolinea flava TaxID=2059302 RepID=A0A364XXX5_9BACT|nr:DUF1579 domain-containing protein [Pseudochryseolinea flava]RAV98640.1 hypothetical protein DQQ10_23180 [Pseudochryseolinea flava]